jgi:hypothetical protein
VGDKPFRTVDQDDLFLPRLGVVPGQNPHLGPKQMILAEGNIVQRSYLRLAAIAARGKTEIEVSS